MKNTEKNNIISNTVKEIDVLSLMRYILRKLWIIAITGAILGAVVYGYTLLLVQPTYQASFTAYVNNAKNKATGEADHLTDADLVASQRLVKTYSEIIMSRTILEAAADTIQLDMDYSTMKKMISTSQEEGTEIIRVNVVATSPELAYKLDVAISKTAPGYIEQIIEGSSMRIIDEPHLPHHRYGPNRVRSALVGAVVGIMISLIIIIIRFFIDDTIKDEKEIEEHFSYPVMGIIPDVFSENKNGYYSYRYEYSRRDSKNSGRTK